jgi:DNA-binding NtrC family response regulator
MAEPGIGIQDKQLREVLVVDDVPEILELFQGLLRRVRRYYVKTTTEVNSQRALELVSQRKFDLVVSDFRMRQVDGIEVLRAAYQANPEGRRVLMTGYNEVPTSLERIRSASVDAYIQKPLKSQDLLILLDAFLANDTEAIKTARAHAREVEATATLEERSTA